MIKGTFIILFVTIVIVNNGCKKNDNTNSAGYSMSATINGVAWHSTPCTACIGGGSSLQSNFSSSGFSLQGQQNTIYILFTVGPIRSTGTYIFKKNVAMSGNGFYINTAKSTPSGDINYYDSIDNPPGSATVTKYDTINKIIEGTFAFDAAARYDQSLIVHITEGKFSVKYQ